MAKRPFPKLLLGAAVLGAVGLGGVLAYNTSFGLGLRAQLGQTSGTYLHALAKYEDGDIARAITTIEPLVAAGHEPSLNLICGFVQAREPVAPTAEECVTTLEDTPAERLESLSEIALWAQEWDVAGELVERRIAEGDLTAHFDKARLIHAAPAGRFGVEDLLKALQDSNAARDPRGQYAAVVHTLNVNSAGALSPVLTEILDRQPKFTASDAYFELAKLMQTGAISSDLSYVEVLRRADATGNPHAARYLAQYYIANRDQDPTGAERQAWMAKSAASGDPVAQYNRAVAILDQPGGTEEAIALLDRAAGAGFAPAMNLLGATLWQKPDLLAGLPQDLDPMKLMEAAAERGDANAHFNLGNIHLSQRDRSRAMPHLRRAAELGNQPARDLLERLGDAEN